MPKSCFLALVLTLWLCHLPRAVAEDWPQWRGPARDGVWHETGLIDTFPSAQLAWKWSAPLGSGYSGPTVSQGRVYLMDRQTVPEEVERVWEDQTATPRARWSNIHMVRQDDHLVGQNDRIWMFNERGELIMARLSPAGFHEISRAKLIEPTTDQLDQRGGVCWSHPAFANQHVFARNDQQLVCANLAKK